MPDLIRKRSVRNGTSNLQWSQDNMDYLRKSKPPRKTKPSPHKAADVSDSDSDTPSPLLNMKDVERGALFFRSYANQMAVVPSILSNPKRREAAMRVARLTVGRHERAIARNTKAQNDTKNTKDRAIEDSRRGALQFGSFGD